MGIARLGGSRLKISLGPDELNDKGIRAAKKYLDKLCGVKVPNDDPWQAATKHGLLRNVFSHSRGRVKKDNNDVRRYVAANPDLIRIDDHDRLRLTQEFCLQVLKNVGVLLRSILVLAEERLALLGNGR